MPPSSFPTPRLDKLRSELLLFATLDSSSFLSEMPSLVPTVVGNYFSNVFFGIVLVQATGYQRRHRSDSLWIKIPLYSIVALNLVLSMLNLSREIKTFGLPFGDRLHVGQIHGKVEDLTIGFLSMIISASSQTFLLARFIIFKRALRGGGMSKLGRAGTSTIALFIALSFVSGVMIQASFVSFSDHDKLIEASKFSLIGEEGARYAVAHLIWLISTISANLLLCVTLSWGLHLAKTRNRKSRSFLQMIIDISLRSGALLLGSQILVLILYFVSGPEWTEVALLCIPQLATNTLMSSITSPRETARTQERAVQEDERRRLEFQVERTIKDDDLADSDEKKTPFPILLKTFRSGVEVQMTSRIEVDENVVMGDGLRLGNSVLIQGPLDSTPPTLPARRRSLLLQRTLLLDHFPTSQVNSIQHRTYDPDTQDEYQLPYIDFGDEA